MGKKKNKAGVSPADALKEKGNNSFANGRYEEAVIFYTHAIDMVKENPNHIYFANRANAWLEIRNFNLCIEDCD